MSTGLLLYADQRVAEYLFTKHVQPRMKYDMALGLMVNGQLAGGVLLQSYNGFNVELSYYGAGTMTPGIVRSVFRILISTLNVSRVTVTVSRRNKRLMRALRNLGFVLEGTQRCFYGFADSVRNTGVRFVIFRDRLEKIARVEQHALGVNIQ